MDKNQVDLLITNGDVVTMDPARTVIQGGAVAVQDGEIVGVGKDEELLSEFVAQEEVNASGKVVLPGLVDTHFHTAQQFERAMLYTLSKEAKLEEPIWKNYLISFEGSLTDEDLYLSALFAYTNLLKQGTTCFADAGGPRPEVMAPAIDKVGIRGILARSTLDMKEGIPRSMQDDPDGIADKGRSLFEEWHGKAGGRIRIWMGMRQIMVCSLEALKAIKEAAQELDTAIHIHLAEGTYEVDYAVKKTGLRPAEYLDSIGFLGPDVHAAHSVLLSEKELDLYETLDVSVAHCPAAAFQYCGVAKVPEMLRRGIRVGLGTDGALASGGSLDLFRQMHISQYTLVSHYGLPYYDTAPVGPDDLLEMATIGGARALRWDEDIGSIEVGKKADLVLLRQHDLDVLPSYDPLYTAAGNASGAQVDTVLVDGEVVVEDGELVTVDEGELKTRIRERAPQIVSRFQQQLK